MRLEREIRGVKMEGKNLTENTAGAHISPTESVNSRPETNGRRKEDDSLLTKVKQLAYFELRESGIDSHVKLAKILGISTRTITRYKEYFDHNPDTHEKLLHRIRHWSEDEYYLDGNVIMIDIIKRIIRCQKEYGGDLTQGDIKNLQKRMHELEQPEPISEKEIKEIIPLYITKALDAIGRNGDYEKKAVISRLREEIVQELPGVFEENPLWLARAEIQHRKKERHTEFLNH